MIESSLYTALSQDAGVSAITANRIYPLVVPTASALPAIDFAFVGGSVQGTFDGRGLAKMRVEVNCWGDTYADAVKLRSAVIQALDGYTGCGFTCRMIAPHDLFDHDLEQYRAIVEFYLWSNLNFSPST